MLDDTGDPGLRTLEMMAVEAIRRGWQGRALAHHCRAISLYPAPYVQRLARVLQAARVPVVTDPHTGPLHARVRDPRQVLGLPVGKAAWDTCHQPRQYRKSPSWLRTCCG